MTSSLRRLLRRFACALLAAVIAVPAAAQQVEPRDGEKFQVVLSPRMILPPENPHEEGERRIV